MPASVWQPHLPQRIGRALRWSCRLLLMAQFVFLVPLSVPVHADTNGPSAPVTNWGGIANNACGPCTDTNTWSSGAGPNIGNGICGRCGDKNWKRSSGSCQGTYQGALNCKRGKCSSTATYTFTSTPVGGLGYAGCISAAILGGIVGELVFIPVCASACTVGSVFTLGAACVACIAANVTAASAAACALADCVENCDYIAPATFAGPIVSCCR